MLSDNIYMNGALVFSLLDGHGSCAYNRQFKLKTSNFLKNNLLMGFNLIKNINIKSNIYFF